jgi:uncharacterized protein YjeT (DUF2065 family)
MGDLIAALGIAFVVEGLLWALAPHWGMKFYEAVAHMSEQSLRTAGIASAVGGLFVVWMVRG